MSFLDTLKSLGLWQGQGQQPQAAQQNPYGLDPQMLQQARMAALGNIGGQILAMSQQMTPDQRARMMGQADWTGGMQGNLMNAALMKLMGDAQRRRKAEQARMENARMMIAEQLKGMPAGRQRDEVMFYLEAGDVPKAAERLYAQASADPPQMKTIRVGTQDVTYQWDNTQGKWVPFGAGEAFKPTPDTVVNNNVGGGADDFDKNLMKGVADVYVQAMQAGGPAAETKMAVGQLRELLQNNGGALDGFAATVAPYVPPGMLPEGANDLVAAQSIVAGLIPKQRVPGAGATSDYDAKMFAQSLPSVWNKPGANQIILDTIEAYSDYRIAAANIIADVAADPSIANKSGAIRQAISQLPDPFIEWKRMRGALTRDTGGREDLQPSVDINSALEEYP